MGWGGIQIVVEFLHVFAVIAFVVCQAKETLLNDGGFAVPEGKGKAKSAVSVGPSHEALLAPAIST